MESLYPEYLLCERKLVFCSSRWAVLHNGEFVSIEQMGAFGPSSYAFWWPNQDDPKPQDYYEVASYKTNYPLSTIPKTVLAQARKAIRLLRKGEI